MSEATGTALTREEVLAKLPADVRAAIEANPALVEVEVRARERWFPCKDFVPNVGQQRALEPLRQRHAMRGDFPEVLLVTGGNGAGKTAVAAILTAGACLGPEYLNQEYFGNHEFFRWCQEIRRKRAIKVRFVCDGEDVAENGSLYTEMRKWCPMGEWRNSKGGHYTECWIPSPEPERYHATTIDVKTHQQEVVAHAGPTYDLIVFNEPPPPAIWAENCARLRGGGHIVAFLTPLDLAGYLYSIATGNTAPGEIVHVELSIWDNCIDIPGNRGHLSKSKIEAMKRRWAEINPLEVPAREFGKFTFLAGAIFQNFNRAVHVIPPQPLQQEWNFYMAVDPHPHKPHIAVFVAIDQLNTVRVIGEYPVEDWEAITGTRLTIQQFGEEFYRIENGQNMQFPYMRGYPMNDRIGDPNGMKAEHPNNRTTVASEYSDRCGIDFNLNVDNDVALRIDEIRRLLFYDRERKVDSVNRPRLYVYSTCHNVARALERVSFAKKQGTGAGLSDKVDSSWMDWIDALGYIVVTVDPWHPNEQDVAEGDEGIVIEHDHKPEPETADESVLCRY